MPTRMNTVRIYDLDIYTGDYESVRTRLLNALHNSERLRLVTLNPEILLVSIDDTEFADCLRQSDLMVADGIGLAMLLAQVCRRRVPRIPGIELATDLLRHAEGATVAILGASSAVIEQTRLHLQTTYKVQVTFWHDGYIDGTQESELIQQICELQPDIILVGMPFVRGERILSRLYQMDLRAVMMGVGGSFDVWAGAVRRAPQWMRTVHLEWFWRLCSQPHRWLRITVMLCRFVPLYLRHWRW